MSAVVATSEVERLRRENAAIRKQSEVLTALLQLVSERCAFLRRLVSARTQQAAVASPFPEELN